MEDDSIQEDFSNSLGLTQSVVLVGLMGAGKTTIGRRLARALALPFKDADVEITEAAGCSISDIFAIYGEAMFRDLEKRVLLRLLSEPPCVLATGGGAFINPELREAILAQGTAVWLKAEIDVLVERTSRRNTRPLLEGGDKRDILQRLMQQRYPIYGEAPIAVDSDEGPHEKVVEHIVAAIQAHHGENA